MRSAAPIQSRLRFNGVFCCKCGDFMSLFVIKPSASGVTLTIAGRDAGGAAGRRGAMGEDSLLFSNGKV